ncbi:MAG: SPOR domain-containing protein [Deltaproteobacteria bacterium]|nr:SPOR domain-containing protein [Deltaproteobacteria bacterium]
MYCENCQLEIKEQGEKQCPLCGGPLSESPAAGSVSDKAAGIDFESLMQDDAPAFVLDDDDESGEPAGQAAPEMFNPGTNLGEQKTSAVDLAQTAGTIAFSDDSSADMLDQVLQEYDPLVDEHFKVKKTGSKSTTTLLLILLLVCVLGGGAYYYFMMGDQEAPEPVAPVKIARPQKKDAVLDKVLRKEQLSARQQAADNATQAAQKPDEAQPVQAEGKRPEAPVIAVQQPSAAQPAEPAAPAKMPEKAARQDRRQPEAAMEKTEPAPAAPQPAVAPVPASVAEQRPAPAAAPAAEEAKKTTEPAVAPVAKPPVAAAGKPAFSVLAGSFRSQSNAEAEAARIRKLGFDARTLKVDLKGKGQWHRVLIGSWQRRADALQAVGDVRRKTGKKDASVIAAE